jgi:prepilin-type N-terminal cleavage/methylation domain-containing protein
MRDSIDVASERRGMTIVELLVVLVVIGILAGLAILVTRDSRARGDLARLESEAHNFRLAQEMYKLDAGRTYNGPFTPQATKAAGFNYTPSPDISITIHSPDTDNWQATMTSASASAIARGHRPICFVALGDAGLACGLDQPSRDDMLDGSSGGAPPAEITPTN